MTPSTCNLSSNTEPVWEDMTSQETADDSVTGDGKVKFEVGENGGDIELQAEKVKEEKAGIIVVFATSRVNGECGHLVHCRGGLPRNVLLR